MTRLHSWARRREPHPARAAGANTRTAQTTLGCRFFSLIAGPRWARGNGAYNAASPGAYLLVQIAGPDTRRTSFETSERGWHVFHARCRPIEVHARRVEAQVHRAGIVLV